MKLALFILPLVAAAPIPGFRWWSYGTGFSPAPAPQKQPPTAPEPPAPEPPSESSQPQAQPETEPEPAPQPPVAPEEPAPAPAPQAPRPAVYQNATDWWVPGTVLHGTWREGKWDGVDNTAGAVMYVDDRNIAVTIVPI